MRDVSQAHGRRGFQAHAASFVVGIIALFIINYFTTPSYYWALWCLLGWSIGLFAHYWFVLGPGAGKSYEADGKQG